MCEQRRLNWNIEWERRLGLNLVEVEETEGRLWIEFPLLINEVQRLRGSWYYNNNQIIRKCVGFLFVGRVYLLNP